MSSAYASPPHSTRASTPRSPPAHSQASTSKSTIETSMQALSPPPPTLREILSAYASKGQGDRTMLIALLNAKAAEEQRIAAVATLQQNVLQMQMSIVAAQLQAQSRSRTQPREEPELRSPVSPSPRSRRAASPRGLKEMSPLMSGRREKSHPYAAARPVKREEEVSWAPRRSWDSVSDERSTSEDCASGRE